MKYKYTDYYPWIDFQVESVSFSDSKLAVRVGASLGWQEVVFYEVRAFYYDGSKVAQDWKLTDTEWGRKLELFFDATGKARLWVEYKSAEYYDVKQDPDR